MGGFLFDKIIFGPVISRRMGVSLGVNLLPVNHKYCTFNCVYCECGWTHHAQDMTLPTAEEVKLGLKAKLLQMKENKEPLDNITFAGNGEPTLHPGFDLIIDHTIKLRNTYYPEVKITVLSNGTQLHRDKIFQALKRVDSNVLKLDAGTDKMFRAINIMKGDMGIQYMVDQYKRYEGALMIQTLFVRGTVDDGYVDNTSEEEINAWLNHLDQIRPQSVQIYSFERETPADGLEKIPCSELRKIAARVEQLGIKTDVYC